VFIGYIAAHRDGGHPRGMGPLKVSAWTGMGPQPNFGHRN